MASPSPVTMPSFEVVNAAQCVLKQASTVLGQATDVKFDQKVETKKVFRIGDSSAKTTRKPTAYTGSFSLFLKTVPDDLALILNGSSGATATGVFLDSSLAAATYTVEVYDGAGGVSDILMGIFTITNMTVNSASLPIGADADVKSEIQFDADSIVYVAA